MTELSPFSATAQPLSIAGIVCAAGAISRHSQVLDDMAGALPATESTGLQTARTGVRVAAGDSYQDETLTVACCGRPYWLQGTRRPAGAADIAESFRRHGSQMLEQLGGPFALVVIDATQDEVLVAVDRFAREQMYWHQMPDALLLASSADAIVAHPDLSASLSDQGLFHYLFFHMVPGPDSIYDQVHRIPAAHCLHWRKGKIDVRPYWMPNFTESPGDSAELRDGVLRNLGAAVAHDGEGDDCGAFLSGGLDSSTVAGLLAGIRPGADSYSIGFDADGYDEMAYARIASRHFGTTAHEYYLTPDDVLSALPRIAAAYDEPFGNSSAVPTLFCAGLARQDGKTRLLAGDGGDELYAGNERYAKQKIFETYHGLPVPLQRLTSILVSACPEKLTLCRKARSYVAQAAVPLPERLQAYNHVYRLGVESMFNPEFAASIDPRLPLRLQDEIYRQPQQASTLNRMLYLDWHHTLADNDLRKVGRMCRLAGIEVAYPMLDEAVVEHSTTVSSSLKLPGNKLRHFYKQAVRGFLPDEILAKSKHGFGLPFGVWLAEHAGLQAMAEDCLSQLRGRRILKPAFIDQAVQMHRQGHSGYYGELVWIMVMLELWLDSRGHTP